MMSIVVKIRFQINFIFNDFLLYYYLTGHKFTCCIILKCKEKKVTISKLFCHELVLQCNIAFEIVP